MTLEERIDAKIEERLMEKDNKNKKKFKIPFSKRVGTAKKKLNYITLIKINENSQIKFDVVQINDQTIMVDGVPRLATSKDIMYYKKNPIMILPSWSVEPFSPGENFLQSLEDGSNKKGYAILLEKMKKEQLGPKKQLGGIVKLMIGLAFAAIIGYAFISGGI